MKNWGIRARVIILAVVPTALVALVMGAYFVTTRIQDLSNSLEVRGITAAKYLSQSAEFAVLSANHRVLNNLTASARDGDQDILAVAIYNKQNVLLASSGTHELIANLSEVSKSRLVQNKVLNVDDGLLIRTPILSNTLVKNRVSVNQSAQNAGSLDQIGVVAVYITQQNISLRQYQTLITAVIILVLGLILGAILAQNMARNITTPIIQLANAVKRIKEGQLNIQIKSKTTGELKTLVNGFNNMSDSLFKAREEMQATIEEVTADINASNTALEEQNVKLILARKEAIESSRVKSEFLANMSHEIRTPMNGVIGFTNLLLKTDLNEKQKKHLITINNSSNGLLKIIDDILDFSKIEAGKMEMEQHSLDLSKCIDDTLAFLAPFAQSKNLELIGIVYQDVPKRLLGDAGRITQIISNLCNNAIKFTDKGTVQVRVMIEDESPNRVRLKFNITDTGIGLNKDQQKVLFQAFTQADTTTTRKFGGTGLGLVISKKLIESMNGKIGLDSQENVGSTFWFTLDLAKDLEAPPTPKLTLPGKVVLLHDSNSVSQHATKYLFTQLGSQVETFSDLTKMTQETQRYKKLDKEIHLIAIGGYNSKNKDLVYLKNICSEMKIPLGILINSNEEQVLNEYAKAGFDKLISKPLTVRSTYDALLKWLTQDQANQSLSVQQEKPVSQLTYRNLHILCVDDNDANLQLIEAFVDDFNLTSDFASGGFQAIEKAKENQYDLIFMDIQMPEIDGIETTKQIRKLNLHYARTPIIALTAHAIKGEKQRIIRSGMNDFLTKPIGQESLRVNIEKWTKAKVNYKKRNNQNLPEKHAQTNLSSGVDWSLSLKNANNKEDLARQMLKMLVESFPQVIQNTNNYLKANNLKDLVAEIHKFHGATAYCGVPHLKEIAFAYEAELKLKGITDNIKNLHNKFVSEMNNVKATSKNYL